MPEHGQQGLEIGFILVKALQKDSITGMRRTSAAPGKGEGYAEENCQDALHHCVTEPSRLSFWSG